LIGEQRLRRRGVGGHPTRDRHGLGLEGREQGFDQAALAREMVLQIALADPRRGRDLRRRDVAEAAGIEQREADREDPGARIGGRGGEIGLRIDIRPALTPPNLAPRHDPVPV
jgi:hypothetical protein